MEQPFRAREPDWKKLEDPSGAIGVPLVLPKPVTSPKAFSFRSEERIAARRAARDAKAEAGPTKAIRRQRKPLSTGQAPARTASAPLALTTPESPHFSNHIDDPSRAKTRAQQRAERAARRAAAEEEKARLKREKAEQEEFEAQAEYEKSRFHFKPPPVSARCLGALSTCVLVAAASGFYVTHLHAARSQTKQKPLEIRPSNVALTVPTTPHLATKTRAAVHDVADETDQ